MLLSALIISTLLLQQPQPQIPPFPQRTADSLFEQLGQCKADIADYSKWSQSLVDEIKRLNVELAKAKSVEPETKPAQ